MAEKLEFSNRFWLAPDPYYGGIEIANGEPIGRIVSYPSTNSMSWLLANPDGTLVLWALGDVSLGQIGDPGSPHPGRVVVRRAAEVSAAHQTANSHHLVWQGRVWDGGAQTRVEGGARLVPTSATEGRLEWDDNVHHEFPVPVQIGPMTKAQALATSPPDGSMVTLSDGTWNLAVRVGGAWEYPDKTTVT